MAGYSGTPLPKKLGLKPGARFVLVGAPAGFERALVPLPEGATRAGPRSRELDVALLFVTSASDLARRFGPLAARLGPAGRLWVAWPKKSAKVPTDLSFDVVQRTGLGAGLVDVKVCAVDETWSGLAFCTRLADRPARKA